MRIRLRIISGSSSYIIVSALVSEGEILSAAWIWNKRKKERAHFHIYIDWDEGRNIICIEVT
jgi:hypothetical protein